MNTKHTKTTRRIERPNASNMRVPPPVEIVVDYTTFAKRMATVRRKLNDAAVRNG